MVRCFRTNPTALQVTDTLDLAVAVEGVVPKYIISDKGSQFQNDYRDWCDARDVKPRFGAIGQHGSIAVVERFIRTIKQECVRRIFIPLATDAFETELAQIHFGDTLLYGGDRWAVCARAHQLARDR